VLEKERQEQRHSFLPVKDVHEQRYRFVPDKGAQEQRNRFVPDKDAQERQHRFCRASACMSSCTVPCCARTRKSSGAV
jgi:hypothetical protein